MMITPEAGRQSTMFAMLDSTANGPGGDMRATASIRVSKSNNGEAVLNEIPDDQLSPEDLYNIANWETFLVEVGVVLHPLLNMHRWSNMIEFFNYVVPVLRRTRSCCSTCAVEELDNVAPPVPRSVVT